LNVGAPVCDAVGRSVGELVGATVFGIRGLLGAAVLGLLIEGGLVGGDGGSVGAGGRISSRLVGAFVGIAGFAVGGGVGTGVTE
jgi:hypothetical protein